MPVSTTYPAIHIEELPRAAHAIAAAPTGIAAFIGYSHPTKTRQFGAAVRVFSFADFEREFGWLAASDLAHARLGHAVHQFFVNGGSDAWVVGLEPRPGKDDAAFSAADFTAQLVAGSALDKVELFDLLVLPGVTDADVVRTALSFAERKRAFMIVDPPLHASIGAAGGAASIIGVMEDLPRSPNGAIYYPWLMASDPVSGQAVPMPPSGFVAGVFARTDRQRGVWKAPAGIAATVRGTSGPVAHGQVNDVQAGALNQASVNALRSFSDRGTVVFGARTLAANVSADPHSRYVPAKRMALFIEQTLQANLHWAVFEPNDEALWSAIRTAVDSFMLSLFRQGAFAGDRPSQAFRVICDDSTTTPDDQARGIARIMVAFAPLKPAEFVVIKIAQRTGQSI
jgi:hypothetical protein